MFIVAVPNTDLSPVGAICLCLLCQTAAKIPKLTPMVRFCGVREETPFLLGVFAWVFLRISSKQKPQMRPAFLTAPMMSVQVITVSTIIHKFYQQFCDWGCHQCSPLFVCYTEALKIRIIRFIDT